MLPATELAAKSLVRTADPKELWVFGVVSEVLVSLVMHRLLIHFWAGGGQSDRRGPLGDAGPLGRLRCGGVCRAAGTLGGLALGGSRAAILIVMESCAQCAAGAWLKPR